uniref:opsin-5-like n=1 Tax=Pristiophorus japonicus TaxID=55135 RepID=UPI00398EFFE2
MDRDGLIGNQRDASASSAAPGNATETRRWGRKQELPVNPLGRFSTDESADFEEAASPCSRSSTPRPSSGPLVIPASTLEYAPPEAAAFIARRSFGGDAQSKVQALRTVMASRSPGILSMVGNSTLLLIAYRRRHMLKPAEYFIVNIAISDLAMILTLLPLAIPSCFTHRWLFSQGWCSYYAFCGVLFGICSLTNLTVLSIVCCMKVCYPVYGNRFTSEYACLLIASAWAYASIFAISPLVNWGHYGLEPYGTACCIDWKASNTDSNAMSYTVALFVFCYIFPCIIITTSYTLILLTVKGSRRAVQQHVSPQTNSNNAHNLIVKLSVAVCIGFVTAWTPYAIVAIWAAFGNFDTVQPLAFALSAMFAKSSSLYNPFVHLLFKPNFRKFLSKDIAHLLNLCRKQRGPCSSGPDLTLQSVCDQGSLDSTKFPKGLVDMDDACNACTDTFVYFSNYPKSQSLGRSTSKASTGIPSVISTAHGPMNRTTLVMLTGSMTSPTESIEVAIDTQPTQLTKDLT